MGDVKVRRLGRQLFVNIPSDVVSILKLKHGMSLVIESIEDNRVVLAIGEGPVRVVAAGDNKLRLVLYRDLVPFKEGDRVLVGARDNRIIIERIDYYIVKPTVDKGRYYRVTIPWELVEKTGLRECRLVKVYEENGKIVMEPLS